MKNLLGKFVLVTTKSRNWRIEAGVLEQINESTVTLTDSRMIVFFSRDSGGAGGIATRGPGKDARVGPRCDTVIISGWESVSECTCTARKEIEAEPWH